MEKYIIPLRSEEGTYTLNDIILKTTEQDNDYLTIEYDKETDIINLAEKFHRTYSLGVDPLENVMVEYRSPYSFFQKGAGSVQLICTLKQKSLFILFFSCIIHFIEFIIDK